MLSFVIKHHILVMPLPVMAQEGGMFEFDETQAHKIKISFVMGLYVYYLIMLYFTKVELRYQISR